MNKRSLLGTNTFMLAGGILLVGGIALLFISEVGYHQEGVLAAFLGVLSRPAIITGFLFIFLGLIKNMPQGSLRWLRITLTILCSSLAIVIGLYTLVVSLFLFSGF